MTTRQAISTGQEQRKQIMNHSSRRVNAFAQRIAGRRYLEIGVSTGRTFRDVEMPERTAVDPAYAFDTKTVENDFTRCLSQTSDAFFGTARMSPGYDIIFIDGLHTFEQVVRDFSNAVLHSPPRSFLLSFFAQDINNVLARKSRAEWWA